MMSDVEDNDALGLELDLNIKPYQFEPKRKMTTQNDPESESALVEDRTYGEIMMPGKLFLFS